MIGRWALHPLERWFDGSLRPIFGTALVLSLVLSVVLQRIDAGLKTAAAPLGIISFELAGARATHVLGSWGEAARRDALLLQGLDYAYLLSYSTALASGALLLGRRLSARRPRFAALAGVVAWLQTLAAVCDAIENLPLILMLRSGVADPAGASVSRSAAIGKFALVAVGFVYLLAGAALVITGPRSSYTGSST